MEKKEQFIVIRASIVHNVPVSSAVLFDTFDEALTYARNDGNSIRHLANVTEEKVGTGKRHATIRMVGSSINVSWTISDLQYDKKSKVLDTHRSTYVSWDYLYDDQAI